MKLITLYRRVGIKELELIAASAWKAFPPRLFWQPIFYPVLNQHYAEQIAGEWNTEDESSGYCGIVTAFDVTEEHFNKYDIENVGGDIHNELWVPAEKLPEFNENILGEIRVVNAFFGAKFNKPGSETIRPLVEKFKK